VSGLATVNDDKQVVVGVLREGRQPIYKWNGEREGIGYVNANLRQTGGTHGGRGLVGRGGRNQDHGLLGLKRNRRVAVSQKEA